MGNLDEDMYASTFYPSAYQHDRSKVKVCDALSEPPSPTNYSNFVHEQNDYGGQRDPDGQRVASEEVQGHACPAEASSH
jgi:hypothetical protein